MTRDDLRDTLLFLLLLVGTDMNEPSNSFLKISVLHTIQSNVGRMLLD